MQENGWKLPAHAVVALKIVDIVALAVVELAPMAASVISEDGAPLTAKGRYAVPGYSGHIPGKAPEGSNMGKRFAVCNEHGMKSLREPKLSDQRQPISGRIPGYSGHIPGKLEDSYGTTWQKATKAAGEVRPGAWATTPSKSFSPTAASPRPGSGKAVAAVAGYSGHIPGKHADNVVGARFAAANFMAAVGEPDGHAHRRGAGAAKGKGVPGYTGYVHGVLPEADVMGMPFKAANEHADKARLSVRAKHPAKESQSEDRKPWWKICPSCSDGFTVMAFLRKADLAAWPEKKWRSCHVGMMFFNVFFNVFFRVSEKHISKWSCHGRHEIVESKFITTESFKQLPPWARNVAL